MLSAEKNRELTQVAAGTRMGELLRRYWYPIGAVTELDANPIKPVRLLAEDLVLYRDGSGRYGLLERHCPHRGADLSYGWPEQRGLRCSYHGWLFDECGGCLAQPFEDTAGPVTRFRQTVRAKAYKVEQKAGLLFAYLGPDPAPLCPNWELFEYQDGFRQIVFADIPCNWLQCAENNVDPIHFEWLHNNWSIVQATSTREYGPEHLRIQVEEWEFGFGYRRVLTGTDEDHDFWKRTRLHLMPGVFMPSGNHLEYRVPVDERNTLSVIWSFDPVPHEHRPYMQERIPHWHAPIIDPDTGQWISTHTTNQDTIAWVGQGPIADRSREHLGRSDVGVVKLRQQLQKDMEAVARGEDPMGVVRDPEKYKVIRWPHEEPSEVEKSWPMAEWKQRWYQRHALAALSRDPSDVFPLYAGQPADVRRAFLEAVGLSEEEVRAAAVPAP